MAEPAAPTAPPAHDPAPAPTPPGAAAPPPSEAASAATAALLLRLLPAGGPTAAAAVASGSGRDERPATATAGGAAAGGAAAATAGAGAAGAAATAVPMRWSREELAELSGRSDPSCVPPPGADPTAYEVAFSKYNPTPGVQAGEGVGKMLKGKGLTLSMRLCKQQRAVIMRVCVCVCARARASAGVQGICCFNFAWSLLLPANHPPTHPPIHTRSPTHPRHAQAPVARASWLCRPTTTPSTPRRGRGRRGGGVRSTCRCCSPTAASCQVGDCCVCPCVCQQACAGSGTHMYGLSQVGYMLLCTCTG